MDVRLTGKRALVTGAGSGIGRATAIRLASGGACVGVLDIDGDAARATAAHIENAGGRAAAYVANVGSEDAMRDAVEACEAWGGGLEVVVANAGVELMQRDNAVDSLDEAVWRETLDTNLTGMFLTCKHGVRALLRAGGGVITITGSPTGIYGMEIGAHAYTASKGGCHSLARVMAHEYATQGIRVNAIVPGFIATAINEPILADASALDEVLSQIPMRRAGTPEEVAALIAFLSSDDASYITGALYAVDGGMTAI